MCVQARDSWSAEAKNDSSAWGNYSDGKAHDTSGADRYKQDDWGKHDPWKTSPPQASTNVDGTKAWKDYKRQSHDSCASSSGWQWTEETDTAKLNTGASISQDDTSNDPMTDLKKLAAPAFAGQLTEELALEIKKVAGKVPTG